MKLSGRKIILLIVLGCVLITTLVVAVNYFRARHAVAEYRKQLIAAGEKLSIAELIPPVPTREENGADLVLRAHALSSAYSNKNVLTTNPPSAMWMVAKGKAMVRWQQPYVRERSATNSWDDVGEEIARMDAELTLLNQLSEKQTADFKINYHQGFHALLPMLAPMKGISQRLGYASVFALYENDTVAATGHIRAMIGATRILKDEPLAISQLVRIALAQITQSVIWEFLQSTNVTDAQLASIQKDWEKLEFAMPMVRALEMERAMSEAAISDMRDSRAGYARMTSYWGGGGTTFNSSGNIVEDAEELVKVGWANTVESSREGMWRAVWSYPDQLRSLKGKQVQLEAIRMAAKSGNVGEAREFQFKKYRELGFTDEKNEEEFVGIFNESDVKNLFSSSVVSLSKLIDKIMTVDCAKQLALTAIALKRHQVRYGKLPETLNTLVPEFLSSVPADPVNAQPLRYKLNPDGTFLLYSVGNDGVDDGGDASNADAKSKNTHWQRGRDWVWPQPATQVEIEEYFAKPRQ